MQAARRTRRSFLRRLVLFYTVVFSGIVALLVTLSYIYLARLSEQAAQVSRAQLCDKMVARLDDYIGEMKGMAEQISADSRIAGAFSALSDSNPSNYFSEDILTYLDMGSILTSHVGPSARFWRVSLYNDSGDYISSGAFPGSSGFVQSEMVSPGTRQLLAELSADAGRVIVLPPAADRWNDAYSGQYISLAGALSNSFGSAFYGIVEIQQPADELEARMALGEGAGMTAFLLDGQGRQILPAGDGYSALDPGSYQSVGRQLSECDWTFVIVQSKSSVLEPYSSLVLFLMLGGVVLMLALVFVIYAASRRVSAPLVNFTRRVQNATLGNLPGNWVVEEGIDEIHELGLAFSVMVRRLTDSAEMEKKAYLHAIQSRMNPHFLYNTLSLISALGLEDGSDRTVYACECLSGMLRYTLGTGFTTLEQELVSIRDYLEIMRLRYEGHFSYDIVTDGSAGGVTLPRLVLQPLVENCFEHAFKDVPPPWLVRVQARVTDASWQVSVSDNGCGFDGDRLRKLEDDVERYSEKLSESYGSIPSGGIGLMGALIRLKLSGSVSWEISRNGKSGAVITLSGSVPAEEAGRAPQQDETGAAE